MTLRDPPIYLSPIGPSWPQRLNQIEGPPAELWARGRLELLRSRPAVAIVGSRAPTPYGEAQARRFARALASAGLLIVSGMARGIDHAAHEGAFEVEGDTLAVLGCGVDRPWPAGPLAERLAVDGLLLSELEPGAPPRRHHFPRRNRLISGLAAAVLVIEAARASGSLITARWAADQGRDVFALPGRVDHPMSRGAHHLIREGAALVEDPEEILADLGLDSPPAPKAGRNRSHPHVDELERDLLDALRGETLTAEELSAQLGRELTAVLASLVALELRGLAVRGPGGLHRLA